MTKEETDQITKFQFPMRRIITVRAVYDISDPIFREQGMLSNKKDVINMTLNEVGNIFLEDEVRGRMKLINTDKLIHALCTDYINGKKTLGQVIDDQDVAYDIDAVIAALNTAARNYSGNYYVRLDEAIEIVKNGGR